jgi:hypothetical protein
MYLHIRKYQLVNSGWRSAIDLKDYETTIRQIMDAVFGDDLIEVHVESRCFRLTLNNTNTKIPMVYWLIWGKNLRLIYRVLPVMP